MDENGILEGDKAVVDDDDDEEDDDDANSDDADVDVDNDASKGCVPLDEVDRIAARHNRSTN